MTFAADDHLDSKSGPADLSGRTLLSCAEER